MRVLLTDKEYLISSDMEIVSNLSELNRIVDNLDRDEVEYFYLFVDLPFVTEMNLKQLELLRYEFKDFRIILDKSQELFLILNSNLMLDLYYLAPTETVANNIFIKSEKVQIKNKEIMTYIQEVEELIKNDLALKSLFEYDIMSIKILLESFLKALSDLTNSNILIKEELELKTNENLNLKKNLEVLREEMKLIEQNRDMLLEENLKMKYSSFKSRFPKAVRINHPLVYVKSLSPQKYILVQKFFEVVSEFVTRKYGLNCCFTVIDDPHTISLKEINPSYGYVISEGVYDMNIGNKIITTPEYCESLFNYWESKAVKDIYVVLDFSLNTQTHVVGEGAYIVVKNNNVSKSIYSISDDMGIVVINEVEILDLFKKKLDDFNLEIELSRSKLFKKVENLLIASVGGE